MDLQETRTAIIPQELAGTRLDQALASVFPEFSRSRLSEWIRGGLATVDRRQWRPRDRVAGGERVELKTAPAVDSGRWQAQPLDLVVIHQDAHLLVVDKPVGLVVHPGAGNPDGTLVNALLHRDPALAQVPRAGVVHRLDKNTSGLLVVARTLLAHKYLVTALKNRQVEREYLAIVAGVLSAGGRVDAPVGRHRVQRTRMAVSDAGRPAATRYRVERRFASHTLIRLNLESGRTHQIRVHMAHIDHPVIGDPTYGGRLKLPANATPALIEQLSAFKRQALHATRLQLNHPVTDQQLEWQSPLPPDMQALLDALEANHPPTP
ncbi:MAG: 23S rRNA pseudouridine(1911/1915/1917) synthase RluD [Gammaproteobacteria bacterium]|nr:23S rRNA pseudouridine(1911/1915/1917) synthase RluD [Gammaproteobacteria bacterium]MDX2458597.1 23S rRNA pseudouridine(1911/1915/1917) synthase RluD [Gammaproteobacteria bacterium]